MNNKLQSPLVTTVDFDKLMKDHAKLVRVTLEALADTEKTGSLELVLAQHRLCQLVMLLGTEVADSAELMQSWRTAVRAVLEEIDGLYDILEARSK